MSVKKVLIFMSFGFLLISSISGCNNGTDSNVDEVKIFA